MMGDKLRAELAFLLTATLRDQCVHRHAASAERRTVFAPPPGKGGEMRGHIDAYDVQPVVERGEDPRDYDWTCVDCE